MAWNLAEFNRHVLPLVQARLVTASTIAINVANETGRKGGTVNFESPYIVTGDANLHTQADRDAKNPFIFGEPEEQITPITLGPFVYKGTNCPYDFRTFSMNDVKPIAIQSAAIVGVKINKMSGALLQAEIDAATPVALNADENVAARQILKALLQAKTKMDVAGVDTFQRRAAVSPEAGEILLSSDQFSNADQSGSVSALREATIGRVYGFDVHIDTTLTGLGFVAYERYAFGLVVRPAAKSAAAVSSEVTLSDNGNFVLSSTLGFDPDQQADKLVVGAFVGLGKLDPVRSVGARFTEAV